MGYDFMPVGQGNGQPIHEDVTYEFDQFPEDKTEKDLETHVAPGDPRAHEGLPRLHRVAAEAGGRHRAGLHVRDRLHPGESSRCGSGERSSGITRRASSSATPKPTGCCAVPTARLGCIRIQKRSDLARLPPDLTTITFGVLLRHAYYARRRIWPDKTTTSTTSGGSRNRPS